MTHLIHPRILDPVSSAVGGLVHAAAAEAVNLWFGQFVRFIAHMDVSTVQRLWAIVSSTTEPVLEGPAWHSEFSTMAVIGATVVLPLLFAATIHAVVRQDAGGLARTAFVRVPLALLFTAVAVELVSLGLRATDQACSSLIHSAGQPLSALFNHMAIVLAGPNVANLAVNFLYLLLAGLLAFVVWIELAVRSAAVAVATLFLPLALGGSAFPATSHWARRLGETLTALVLSKFAIVAVLTLAVGTLGDPRSGMASVVEGITLLGLAAIAPLALARILPMVETGAAAHLDGLGRHSMRTAASTLGGPNAWITSSAAGAAARGDWHPVAQGSGPGSAQAPGSPFGGVGTRPPTKAPTEHMVTPSPARPASASDPSGAPAVPGGPPSEV
ncbi:MAG: hypothetical protein ACYCSF_12595 [Acidimicrobiales bacterium]